MLCKMNGIYIRFKSRHLIKHLFITIQFVWLGQEKTNTCVSANLTYPNFC